VGQAATAEMLVNAGSKLKPKVTNAHTKAPNIAVIWVRELEVIFWVL
jgi:hypothetical protein